MYINTETVVFEEKIAIQCNLTFLQYNPSGQEDFYILIYYFLVQTPYDLSLIHISSHSQLPSKRTTEIMLNCRHPAKPSLILNILKNSSDFNNHFCALMFRTSNRRLKCYQGYCRKTCRREARTFTTRTTEIMLSSQHHPTSPLMIFKFAF